MTKKGIAVISLLLLLVLISDPLHNFKRKSSYGFNSGNSFTSSIKFTYIKGGGHEAPRGFIRAEVSSERPERRAYVAAPIRLFEGFNRGFVSFKAILNQQTLARIEKAMREAAVLLLAVALIGKMRQAQQPALPPINRVTETDG